MVTVMDDHVLTLMSSNQRLRGWVVGAKQSFGTEWQIVRMCVV